MTNILVLSQSSFTNNNTTPQFFALGSGAGQFNSTEAIYKTTWRTAGTFSNLYTRVSSNAMTANSTLTYRVGGVNGNQAIVVGPGASGEFTDAINTDSVSAGNQVNYKLVGGSANNYSQQSLVIQFAPTTTTNTVNKLSCNNSLTDTSVGTSYFNPLSGKNSLNITEANAQFKNKIAATLQNLFINISANTASVATVKSRINGADGNLVINITSGTTGVLEDTTHTDSLAVDDLVNTAVNATVVTTITITNIAIDYLTTTGYTIYITGLATGTGVAHATTRNVGIAGHCEVDATELNKQLLMAFSVTVSFLEAFVITNTTTANSTIFVRKNAANGNSNITYGSGVTGYLEDVTNSDSFIATDEINYQVIAGSTGTTLTLANIGILTNYSTPVTILSWLPAYAVEVVAQKRTAQFSDIINKIQPSPTAQNNWLPDYSAEVRAAPKAAVYSYATPTTPVLINTVVINSWYPDYDADVNPYSLAAKFSQFAEPMLPNAIAQNDWYCFFDSQVRANPIAAQFSYVSQKILPNPITQTDWYPSYIAEVMPFLKAAQFSQSALAKILPSPILLLSWLPDYEAQVKAAPPRHQYTAFTDLLSLFVTIDNWLPNYDPGIKPFAKNDKQTATFVAPLLYNPWPWKPCYDEQVKAGLKAAQFSMVVQKIQPSPIAQNNWYPDYDSQVKPYARAAGFTTISQKILLSSIAQINWFPIYDARVFPNLPRAKFSLVDSVIELFRTILLHDQSGSIATYVDETGGVDTYSDITAAANTYTDNTPAKVYTPTVT